MIALVTLQSVSAGVLRASWQASALAAVVLVIQAVLGRRISARVRYGLWGIVLLRLALPFNVSSPVSVHNFYPRTPTPQPIRVAPLAIPELPAVTPVESIPTRKVVDSTPAMSWSQRLAIAWLAGCSVSVGLVLVASVRLSRHVRRQKAVNDPQILELLRSCAKELGVRRLPVLLTGPAAGGPALVGFVRPKLLLPEAVLSFEDEALRLILLHELAHQKRLDVAANWGLALLQAVHWFNPIVHLLFARIRADRELACDERVLSLTQPADRPSYGRTIVRLIESLPNAPRVPAPAVGILAGRRQLRRRITMIAEHRPVRRTWSLVALVGTSIIAAAVCTDAVRGGDAPKARQPVVAAPPPPSIPGAVPVQSLGGLTFTGATAEDPRLAKRLPEVKLDAIPLGDALAFIRDVARVNLFIDRKALETAGISLNEPVTVDLRDISIAQAFRFIGKSAAPAGVELGATADGDVIVFGVLSQPVVTSVPPAPGMVPGGSANMGFGGGMARGSSEGMERAVTRVYDVEKLTHGDPAQLQNLVEIVVTNAKLGKSSMMVAAQPFNGKLVMTATPDLQDQARELLDMLRDAAPAKEAATKPAAAPVAR